MTFLDCVLSEEDGGELLMTYAIVIDRLSRIPQKLCLDGAIRLTFAGSGFSPQE